jgi:hypothetical protein
MPATIFEGKYLYHLSKPSRPEQCEPAIDFLRQLRSSAASMRAAGGVASVSLATPPAVH